MIRIFIILLVFYSCSSAKFVRTGTQYAAKQNDCSMKVYMVKPPRAPYEEICIINVKSGTGFFADKELIKLLPKVKEQGCLCGADAVYIKNSKDGGTFAFENKSLRGEVSAIGIKLKKKKRKTRRKKR